MSVTARSEPNAGADAALVAALFALDPAGFGGVCLRGRSGFLRDAWMNQIRGLLPAGTPFRRLPLNTGDGRMIGGLDLAATLRAGRPVAERGLLTETHGGVLVLAMAERIPATTAARLAAVLDTGQVVVERDGIAGRAPACLGMIALDEGIEDEKPPPALLERLAFHIDLDDLDARPPPLSCVDMDDARQALASMVCGDEMIEVLCGTAMVLGVGSLRAEIFAQRAARAAAALVGRTTVTADDAAIAARLVLAPRATRIPAPPPSEKAAAQPAPKEPGAGDKSRSSQDGESRHPPREETIGDMVLEAARAAIPPGLLMRLQSAAQARRPQGPAGKAGTLSLSSRRGRPAGIRHGDPRDGARLNIVETLRAAAPWQRLRASMAGLERTRLDIRREDFRVTRFKQRSETTTLFVVDASGSLALNRLAEAKGAVELLLKDCYVRRDQVALMAFRGRDAELLLPPTRSLVRAKRSLASLPGGGATPLARAIDAALRLGDQLRRRGQTPVIVFLTDGRGNVARDGAPGRAKAEDDALAAAREARLSGIRTLVVDAAQRPQPSARRLALEMGALYLPLPHADALALSEAVRRPWTP